MAHNLRVRSVLVLVLALAALLASGRSAAPAVGPAKPISVSAARMPFRSRGFGFLGVLIGRQPTDGVRRFTLTRPHSFTSVADLTIYATPSWAMRGARTQLDRPGYFVTGHAYRVANVVLYLRTPESAIGARLFSALKTLGDPVRVW